MLEDFKNFRGGGGVRRRKKKLLSTKCGPTMHRERDEKGRREIQENEEKRKRKR